MTTMLTIKARRLLDFSTTQLWEILTGVFQLVFDDGVTLTVTDKETLYSSYCWDFHRAFDQLPLLSHHHAHVLLKGESSNSAPHGDLLNRIYWDLIDYYGIKDKQKRYDILEMVYDITNVLYNDMIQRTERYVTSIDALDFIHAMEHPEIKEAVDSILPNEQSIEGGYQTIMKVLRKSPDMDNNAIAISVRSNIVNDNQTLQCIGVRGFVTEVDGSILPTPILTSFGRGLRNPYDMIAESRSAAKALYASDTGMKDTEYFARRLQLLAMTIENLHEGDCGSDRYLLWHVKAPTRYGNRVTYAGDLVFLDGKYYLDEETNKLKAIRSKDTHLNGKLIKLRSVLFCQHPDKHGVCSVCFGGLYDNIAPKANLGHVCAATITQQSSQSVLSGKHKLASSFSDPIILNELSSQFFTIDAEGSQYYMNPELKGKGVKMVVSDKDVGGLKDIFEVENIRFLNDSVISSIEFVEFIVPDNLLLTRKPVCVSKQKCSATLTYEFLEYVRIYSWDIEQNTFIFDLSHWDFDKPILKVPAVEYSYTKHSYEIAKVIESRMEELGERTKPESPAQTLVELFYLVNSKLRVNLALLEVIIYANMVRDPNNEDYGLARNSDTAGLNVARSIIRNRSLSAVYAFQEQDAAILDPKSFYKIDRPDSILDVFIDPQAVLEHKKLI